MRHGYIGEFLYTYNGLRQRDDRADRCGTITCMTTLCSVDVLSGKQYARMTVCITYWICSRARRAPRSLKQTIQKVSLPSVLCPRIGYALRGPVMNVMYASFFNHCIACCAFIVRNFVEAALAIFYSRSAPTFMAFNTVRQNADQQETR